jgi:hypothetical protein
VIGPDRRRRGAPATVASVLAAVLASGCGAPPARAAKGQVAKAIEASLASGKAVFTHHEWDRLLRDATRGGLADYRMLRDRRGELDAYLGRVAEAPLDRLAPGELKALLINAYNACTVRSILDHPGVGSIREIPGVWTTNTHTVGGFLLTLDEIEHRVLRPFFRDPRIHFAVNCASLSCAPLVPQAYTGAAIEEQLEERANVFLRDPRNARVEAGALLLSRYFEWYGDDFTASGWKGAAPTVARYVARHATEEIASFVERHKDRPPVRFLEYDWSLNEAPPPG